MKSILQIPPYILFKVKRPKKLGSLPDLAGQDQSGWPIIPLYLAAAA